MNSERAEHMGQLTAPLATVSDRIRILHRQGYSRGEIAQFLGKRYQHVRNVLVEDERRRRNGADETKAPARAVPPPRQAAPRRETILRLRIDEDGRIALPRALLADLGYHSAGVAIAEITDDGCMLLSVSAALDRARRLVGEAIPGNDSLADSLIADRRREAALDQ